MATGFDLKPSVFASCKTAPGQQLDEADPDNLIPNRPAPHLAVAEIEVHFDDVGVAFFGVRVERMDSMAERLRFCLPFEGGGQPPAAERGGVPELKDFAEGPIGREEAFVKLREDVPSLKGVPQSVTVTPQDDANQAACLSVFVDPSRFVAV